MAQLARKAQSDSGWIAFCAVFRGATDSDSLSVIDDWCRNYYRYREESEEIVRSPQFMLADYQTQGFIEGDCDDIATFITAVLKSIGIPARFFAMQSMKDGQFDHVFAEGFSGVWVPIDPTVEAGTRYTVYSQLIEYV